MGEESIKEAKSKATILEILSQPEALEGVGYHEIGERAGWRSRKLYPRLSGVLPRMLREGLVRIERNPKRYVITEKGKQYTKG